MRSIPVRPSRHSLINAARAAVALPAAASLFLAPAAFATAPGDNGTIKIHDARTGEELRKNEPHVCEFYLDAFGFDGGQQAAWEIDEMPPTGTKGKKAADGAITLDAAGHGRTGDMTLPDGHYKLVWNFDGEHGRAKHKVFWVDCGDDGGEPGPGPSTSGSASPSTSASASASASTSPSGKPSPSSSESDAGAAPTSSTEPQGGSGDLADTGAGAPVGTIAAVAAALVAAGAGTLVARRRLAGRR